MKYPRVRMLSIAIVIPLIIASVTVRADDNLSAAQIAKLVSNTTYQGSMTKDAFVEYYAADGSIRGKNYTGKWRTIDNAMCFKYGDNPEKCWGVAIRGAALTLLKEGAVDGAGMLIKGNPYNF